jgi:hypothetical protein
MPSRRSWPGPSASRAHRRRHDDAEALGYAQAQARHIFRDLIEMPATVDVTPTEVVVQFYRRAHLPIIIGSGRRNQPMAVPWWNGLPLRLIA